MGSPVKSQRQGREAVHSNEDPPPPTATNATQSRVNEESQSHPSQTEITESFSEDSEESNESFEEMEGVVLSRKSTRGMTRESTAAQSFKRNPEEECESLLSDIQNLQDQLEEARQDLANSCAEREELVEVLDDLRSKVQPAGRLTDGEVTDFVKQLKYNISNLAEQWPEAVPLKSASIDHKYLRHLQSITPESPDYRQLLQNEDRRPQVVEGFIWKVLTTEVFGHFYWAGEFAAPHMRGLQLFFLPDQLGSPRLCDVQMWTSKTTQLFVKALNSRGDGEKEHTKLYLQRIKNKITSLIIGTLGLSTSSSASIAEQLDDILQGAIELDKRFCQQAARWEWKYSFKSHHEGGLVFDDDFMDLDQAERFSDNEEAQAEKCVKFVISPALVKRGDNEGVNDRLETTVMKMVVSCKGI
ncbi:hypothetical protein H9Q69_007638 [Fusarium xylarioides]|nr:hypothetical protein H9Q69_007638 [Fusarium xylarioides]